MLLHPRPYVDSSPARKHGSRRRPARRSRATRQPTGRTGPRPDLIQSVSFRWCRLHPESRCGRDAYRATTGVTRPQSGQILKSRKEDGNHVVQPDRDKPRRRVAARRAVLVGQKWIGWIGWIGWNRPRDLHALRGTWGGGVGRHRGPLTERIANERGAAGNGVS